MRAGGSGQVGDLDEGSRDVLGDGTADSGHRVVVGVIEIVLTIWVCAVLVPYDRRVAQGIGPASRPLRVLISTVFPGFRLVQNALGRRDVQGERTI